MTQSKPPTTEEPAVADATPPTADDRPEPELVEEDLLVEDVSIDGMCGVY
ncbi:MAG TPA: mycofactocin precursor MftA [Solirubrobacteraceae bacterium]|jgi:mycofactocin precursor|nr:mycofactocin precursor MftA [Solirubrobacteraceae bacterium]